MAMELSQIIKSPSELVKNAKEKVLNAAAGAEDFIRQNPVTSGVTLAGTGAAGITAIQIARKKKSSKKTSTRSKSKAKKKSSTKKKKNYQGHTKRGWKQDRARRSKEKHEVAYQRRKKGKSSSKKKKGKIYYTKRGQPYKIMSNGRARFIKSKRRKS